MKRVSILITSFFLAITLSAQDLSVVKNQLDNMFSGLEKSRVPTGYLWDVSVNLINGEDFNGAELTDSNFVDLPRFQDILKSLNSAAVSVDTIDVCSVINGIQTYSSRKTLPTSISPIVCSVGR